MNLYIYIDDKHVKIAEAYRCQKYKRTCKNNFNIYRGYFVYHKLLLQKLLLQEAYCLGAYKGL